jgi:hypothetical protein
MTVSFEDQRIERGEQFHADEYNDGDLEGA